MVNETKIEPATYGILEDLLEWNKLDPVDKHEIHRNNLCYNIVRETGIHILTFLNGQILPLEKVK